MCVVGKIDVRCRDGNLRTYFHVSPILFGFFFLWKPALHVFCIFVKCFFDYAFIPTMPHNLHTRTCETGH